MPMSRLSAPAIVLAVLFTSLAVPGTAAHARSQVTSPSPDAVGASWTGTMSVSRHFTTVSPGRRDEHAGSATFTNLRSLATTANGNYTATVRGSGEDRIWDDCNGAEHLSSSVPWTADRDYGDHPYFPEVIGLRTDTSGRTFFTAQSLAVESDASSFGCDGEVVASHLPLYGVLGFESGRSQEASGALPDADPDPAHLVGSRTWTLADPPYALVESGFTQYTYTIQYDLRLDYRCASGARPRFFNAQYDGVLAARPMLYYSLDDVVFCQAPGGGIEVLSAGRPTGELTLPPSLAGALTFVGGEFKVDRLGTPSARTYANGAAAVTTTGGFTYCNQVPFGSAKQGLTKLAKKLPAPLKKVVTRWLGRGAKFLIRRLKTSRLIPDAKKKELIRATVLKLVDLSRLSEDDQYALALLVKKVLDKKKGDVEDWIQELFWDGICIRNVWRPTVTVTIAADGTVTSTGDGPDGLFRTRPHAAG